MKHKTPWTQKDDAALSRLYPGMTATELAKHMGRSVSSIYNRAFGLGLEKSAAFLASGASGRLRNGMGINHRFKPGHATWNKGKAGVNGYSATRFRPGHKPANTWKPVGTEKVDDDGILFRKVSDTGNRREDWRPVHVIEWESVNGRVPTGKVVIFADGNRENFARANLLCLTRAELMARNSVHKYPRELKHAMRLVKKLHREIAK